MVLASWGSCVYSSVRLKIAQDLITLVFFCVFAVRYLKTSIRWNHIVAFALIIAAARFTFLPKD